MVHSFYFLHNEMPRMVHTNGTHFVTILYYISLWESMLYCHFSPQSYKFFCLTLVSSNISNKCKNWRLTNKSVSDIICEILNSKLVVLNL